MNQQKSNKTTTTDKRHWGRIILAAFFLLLIFSNTLLTLMGVEIFKGFHENRKLAPKPELRKNGHISASHFIKGFNDYISDHFSFRKPLLISYNSLKYFLFNVSSDRTAMPSREGWVFYGISTTLKDYSRRTKLKPWYVKKIQRSLREREAWLKARGIDFIFLLAPNKHNIYPQYMPTHIRRGKGVSNGEKLVRRLAKHLPGSVVDLFKILRKAAKKHQVYYRTDTHWNHMGGKEAARATAGLIKKSYPHIKMKPLPKFKEQHKILKNANFARVMGVKLDEKERMPVPVGGWKGRIQKNTQLGKMLPKRARVLLYKNPNAPKTKVLVLGDSYMGRFRNYIAEMFGESLFVNLWHVTGDPRQRFPTKFIEAFKPDLVIFQLVERRLRYDHKKKNHYFFAAENPRALKQGFKKMVQIGNTAPGKGTK